MDLKFSSCNYKISLINYLIVGDGDLVLLASGLVAGTDVEDTVGFNVEGDLNRRNTPGGGKDVSKVELAQEMVVLGHGPLSLVRLDGDGELVVAVEGLGLLGGDGGVPMATP